MDNTSKTYGGISLSTLKKLRSILPKLRKLPDQTLRLAQSKREKMEALLPPDFTWAELYELSTKEMKILSMAIFGLLEPLAKAAHEGLNLNEFIVNEAIRSMESDEDEGDYTGGHKGMFSVPDMLAVNYANMGMMQGLFYYGHYMNDLVAMAKNNNDDAFFKAVRIDQTVLACSPFSARLTRAKVFGEKNFMLRLRHAMKAKPNESLLMNQDLRFMLQLMHEVKALPNLSLTEADLLFIQELKVYSDRGTDPARSLMRFIQRWKAERPLSTT